MSATTDLFADWKQAKGYTTDSAAADALRVSKQAVHNWRDRDGNAEAHVLERMAADLGRDPVPYILRAFSEAAKSADAARSLSRLARKLGAACVALLAVAPLMLHSSHAEAAGAQNAQNATVHPIHYAKWLTVRVRRFRAWYRDFLEPSPCSPLASYPASP